MTINEREDELMAMKLSGEITWDEWADLWYQAQMDEVTYPDEQS